MRGLLNRVTLGDAPPQLSKMFPCVTPSTERRTRNADRRHSKQLLERSYRTSTFGRSIFGLVYVWNKLTEDVV